MDLRSSTVLPCDLTQWNDVKKLLKDVTLTKSTDYLISALQKVHDAVHSNMPSGTIQAASVTTRPKAKVRNIFSGLKTFLDLKVTPNEYDGFFDKILPILLQRAVDINNCQDCLHYNSTFEQLEIGREFASSIVACAFLCILPVRSNKRDANLNSLFVVQGSDYRFLGLKAILQYFSALARQTERSSGSIIFVKQKLAENVTANEILISGIPLCPITVSSDHIFQQQDRRLTQVIVGRGVFDEGCTWTDETPELLVYPELIAGQFFFPPAESNEVVTVHGLEPRYDTIMSFIDTLQTPSYQNCDVGTILREIITLECVFKKQTDKGSSSEEPMSHGRASAANDMPSDCLDAALVTRKDKSWRNASSFGSFNISLSRGQSVDFETSSASSTTGDEMTLPGAGGGFLPRRRSSALHSVTSASSRRGSNVQRQISLNSDGCSVELGVCHRRRSSGLSDVSMRSSSSSGKRSSTDFSSEVDEYFENLQQHHSIAAAVIEEENGGLNDAVAATHVDVMSEDLGRVPTEFSSRNTGYRIDQRSAQHEVNGYMVDENHPQYDISGYSPPGQSLLEHFVDNLINEAAQDSRLEIQNHLCQRRHPAQDWVQDEKINDSLPAASYPYPSVDNCSSLSIEQEHTYDAYVNSISVSIMSSALQTMKSNGQLSDNSVDVPDGCTQPKPSKCTCHHHCASLSSCSNLDCFATLFAKVICEEAFEKYRRMIASDSDHLPTSLRIHMNLSDKPPKLKKSSRSVIKKKKRRNNVEKDHDSNVGQPSDQAFNSSRFKDSVLSDFEEELIRSNTSSPHLVLFSDGKRRASEPTILNNSAETKRRRNRQSASVSFCESSDLRHSSDTPLNTDSDFGGSTQKHSIHGSNNDIVDLGSYAQKLVSGAFCEALRDVSRCSPAHRDVNLSRAFVEHALFEASDVVGSTTSIGKHPDNYSEIDLHWVATDFAQQIINEATQTYADRCVPKPIVGSVSGQRSTHGDNQQLFAMIQWIAASLARVPCFHYFTSGIGTLIQMNQVIKVVRNRDLTVSALINELTRWRESSYDSISLFDFLIIKLK